MSTNTELAEELSSWLRCNLAPYAQAPNLEMRHQIVVTLVARPDDIDYVKRIITEFQHCTLAPCRGEADDDYIGENTMYADKVDSDHEFLVLSFVHHVSLAPVGYVFELSEYMRSTSLTFDVSALIGSGVDPFAFEHAIRTHAAWTVAVDLVGGSGADDLQLLSVVPRCDLGKWSVWLDILEHVDPDWFKPATHQGSNFARRVHDKDIVSGDHEDHEDERQTFDDQFLGRYATFRQVLGTQPERPYLPIDGNAHRLCELAGAAQLTHAQIQIVRSLVGIIVEIKP